MHRSHTTDSFGLKPWLLYQIYIRRSCNFASLTTNRKEQAAQQFDKRYVCAYRYGLVEMLPLTVCLVGLSGVISLFLPSTKRWYSNADVLIPKNIHCLSQCLYRDYMDPFRHTDIWPVAFTSPTFLCSAFLGNDGREDSDRQALICSPVFFVAEVSFCLPFPFCASIPIDRLVMIQFHPL